MSRRYADLIALLGLALVMVMFLSRIGGFPLADPDEGRYAEIPREMIELHDWVTPRLNYVKYFEKPPLFYWLVGLSFRAFGMTEWSARLVPALSGLLVVVVTYLLGRSMIGPRGALIASAVLATSPLFFAMSQVVIIDMLLTACMTVALAAAYAAHRSASPLRWAVLAAAATGLGVLAKGPIALLLTGGIVLSFLALRRDGATIGLFLGRRPILVFLAVVAPWFILVSVRNPEFPHFFFVRENFERFASAAVGHPEGPFYYLPVVFGGLFPWTLLAGVLAVHRLGRERLRAIPSDAWLFLGLWGAIEVGFFSLSSAKLAPYVLPAFPAFALLLGGWIDGLLDDEPTRAVILPRFIRCLAWLAGLLLAVSLVGLLFAGPIADWLRRDRVDVFAANFAVMLFTAALLPLIALNLRPRLMAHAGAFATLAVVVIGVGIGLAGAVGGRTITKTARDLAVAIVPEKSPSDLLVAYRKVMPGLSFYTRGRVVQVQAYGELDFGAEQSSDEAEFFWDDTERLESEWRSSRRVFIATNRDLEETLAARLDPRPKVLARDGNRVVLVNFAPLRSAARDVGSKNLESPRG